MIDSYMFIVLGCQVLILLCLIFFTKELVDYDDKKNTRFLILGWCLSLAMVVMLVVREIVDLDKNFKFQLDAIDSFLSVTMSYIMFAVSWISSDVDRVLYSRSKEVSQLKFLLFSGLIFYSVFIFHCQYLDSEEIEGGVEIDEWVANLMIVGLHMTALYYLNKYYLSQATNRRSKIFISIGLITYMFQQCFALTSLAVDWHYSADFAATALSKEETVILDKEADALKEIMSAIALTISAVAKLSLMYGLYNVILSKNHRKLKVDVYQKILKLSLHESISEIRFASDILEYDILPQIDRRNRDVEFNRAEVTENLYGVASAIHRIKYIQDTSDLLFEKAKEISRPEELSIDKIVKKWSNQFDETQVNVNNAIESIYFERKAFKRNDSFRMEASYSGNCIVLFNRIALFQVLSNVFKNIEESYQKNASKTVLIGVSTRIIKNVDEIPTYHQEVIEKISDQKFVRIEIEDDGIGTELSLDEMIGYGVTEKDTSIEDGGAGMFVINNIIANNDSLMYFESPPKESLFKDRKKVNRGAKIIFYIPQAYGGNSSK